MNIFSWGTVIRPDTRGLPFALMNHSESDCNFKDHIQQRRTKYVLQSLRKAALEAGAIY